MELTDQYLLISSLSRQGVITETGKKLLKELILSRDPRLASHLSTDAQALVEAKAKQLYDLAFDAYPLDVAKSVSKSERTDSNQIYGEVDFDSFARILRKIQGKGKFYDLGSGSGRAVLIARLLSDFDECCGVEILRGLHEIALDVKGKFQDMGVLPSVEFIHDSFLHYDWSDGDVIFANSTCFEDSLVDQLAKLGERLAPGSIVVTFTKGLNSSCFSLLQRKRYKMSWGPATVFIHVRNHFDGSHPNIELRDIPDDLSYTDDLPDLD